MCSLPLDPGAFQPHDPTSEHSFVGYTQSSCRKVEPLSLPGKKHKPSAHHHPRGPAKGVNETYKRSPGTKTFICPRHHYDYPNTRTWLKVAGSSDNCISPHNATVMNDFDILTSAQFDCESAAPIVRNRQRPQDRGAPLQRGSIVPRHTCTRKHRFSSITYVTKD